MSMSGASSSTRRNNPQSDYEGWQIDDTGAWIPPQIVQQGIYDGRQAISEPHVRRLYAQEALVAPSQHRSAEQPQVGVVAPTGFEYAHGHGHDDARAGTEFVPYLGMPHVPERMYGSQQDVSHWVQYASGPTQLFQPVGAPQEVTFGTAGAAAKSGSDSDPDCVRRLQQNLDEVKQRNSELERRLHELQQLQQLGVSTTAPAAPVLEQRPQRNFLHNDGPQRALPVSHSGSWASTPGLQVPQQFSCPPSASDAVSQVHGSSLGGLYPVDPNAMAQRHAHASDPAAVYQRFIQASHAHDPASANLGHPRMSSELDRSPQYGLRPQQLYQQSTGASQQQQQYGPQAVACADGSVSGQQGSCFEVPTYAVHSGGGADSRYQSSLHSSDRLHSSQMSQQSTVLSGQSMHYLQNICPSDQLSGGEDDERSVGVGSNMSRRTLSATGGLVKPVGSGDVKHSIEHQKWLNQRHSFNWLDPKAKDTKLAKIVKDGIDLDSSPVKVMEDLLGFCSEVENFHGVKTTHASATSQSLASTGAGVMVSMAVQAAIGGSHNVQGNRIHRLKATEPTLDDFISQLAQQFREVQYHGTEGLDLSSMEGQQKYAARRDSVIGQAGAFTQLLLAHSEAAWLLDKALFTVASQLFKGTSMARVNADIQLDRSVDSFLVFVVLSLWSKPGVRVLGKGGAGSVTHAAQQKHNSFMPHAFGKDSSGFPKHRPWSQSAFLKHTQQVAEHFSIMMNRSTVPLCSTLLLDYLVPFVEWLKDVNIKASGHTAHKLGPVCETYVNEVRMQCEAAADSPTSRIDALSFLERYRLFSGAVNSCLSTDVGGASGAKVTLLEESQFEAAIATLLQKSPKMDRTYAINQLAANGYKLRGKPSAGPGRPAAGASGAAAGGGSIRCTFMCDCYRYVARKLMKKESDGFPPECACEHWMPGSKDQFNDNFAKVRQRLKADHPGVTEYTYAQIKSAIDAVREARVAAIKAPGSTSQSSPAGSGRGKGRGGAKGAAKGAGRGKGSPATSRIFAVSDDVLNVISAKFGGGGSTGGGSLTILSAITSECRLHTDRLMDSVRAVLSERSLGAGLVNAAHSVSRVTEIAAAAISDSGNVLVRLDTDDRDPPESDDSDMSVCSTVPEVSAGLQCAVERHVEVVREGTLAAVRDWFLRVRSSADKALAVLRFGAEYAGRMQNECRTAEQLAEQSYWFSAILATHQDDLCSRCDLTLECSNGYPVLSTAELCASMSAFRSVPEGAVVKYGGEVRVLHHSFGAVPWVPKCMFLLGKFANEQGIFMCHEGITHAEYQAIQGRGSFCASGLVSSNVARVEQVLAARQEARDADPRRYRQAAELVLRFMVVPLNVAPTRLLGRRAYIQMEFMSPRIDELGVPVSWLDSMKLVCLAISLGVHGYPLLVLLEQAMQPYRRAHTLCGQRSDFYTCWMARGSASGAVDYDQWLEDWSSTFDLTPLDQLLGAYSPLGAARTYEAGEVGLYTLNSANGSAV